MNSNDLGALMWTFDMEIVSGRMLGNVCHNIDWAGGGVCVWGGGGGMGMWGVDFYRSFADRVT